MHAAGDGVSSHEPGPVCVQRAHRSSSCQRVAPAAGGRESGEDANLTFHAFAAPRGIKHLKARVGGCMPNLELGQSYATLTVTHTFETNQFPVGVRVAIRTQAPASMVHANLSHIGHTS